MLTEADTCRKFVVPKLQAVGWDNDPHSIPCTYLHSRSGDELDALMPAILDRAFKGEL